MKAISLLQPWATLVVRGIKTIETRSWNSSWRGELVIHASQGKKAGAIAGDAPFQKYIPDFNALPFGAIVGKVLLTDIVPVASLVFSSQLINKLTLEERAFGDYTDNRFAWLLEDAYELEHPIPFKGSLGLWEFPDAMAF